MKHYICIGEDTPSDMQCYSANAFSFNEGYSSVWCAAHPIQGTYAIWMTKAISSLRK